MKNILTLLITLLCCMQLVSGKKNDTSITCSPKALHGFYKQKQKPNLTANLVFSGAGFAMLVGGVGMNMQRHYGDDKNKGVRLSCLGIASALTAVPFIISFRNNQSKGRLSLKKESVATGDRMFYNFNYAAVALTIQP